MRRSLAIAGVFASMMLGAPSAWAQAPGSVFVIALPEAEARLYLVHHPSALALGVYPPSRATPELVRELGRTDANAASDQVARALASANVSVHSFVSPVVSSEPIAGVARAFTAEPPGSAEVLADARLAIAVLRYADDAEAFRDFSDRSVFVLGVGERTPVLVGAPGAGLLRGSLTRRSGIVTPYDISATIVAALGVRVDTRPAVSDGTANSFGALEQVQARLVRDHGFGPGLTFVTVGVAIGGLALGSLGLLFKRSFIAAAGARVSAFAPAGYLAGLFIPSDRWEVRAMGLGGAVVLALLLATKRTRVLCGVVVVFTAFAIAGLTIAAARAPNSEPALSVWGDPLNSWRFFGLRNHLVAFFGGGLIAGIASLGLPWWVLAPSGLAAGALVGAATLGANFVGVLTLAFAALLALFIVGWGRMRWWHLPGAVIGATGAMALAFFADAGARLSHGGRALETIRTSGGAHAAWRLFRERAALNYADIVNLHLIGYVAFVLLVVVAAWMFVWAARSSIAPPGVRAAVAATTAAALAALVVEDSGFYTGGIIGLFAGIVLIAWRADVLRAQATQTEIDPLRSSP